MLLEKKRHKYYGFNCVLTELISDEFPIILDIGAEDGSSCARYISVLKNPIIHAFEPRPDKFEAMKNRYENKRDIFVNKFAMGSKTEMRKFNQIEGG